MHANKLGLCDGLQVAPVVLVTHVVVLSDKLVDAFQCHPYTQKAGLDSCRVLQTIAAHRDAVQTLGLEWDCGTHAEFS